MDIARVIGKIIATQKNERMESCKICIIQPLNHEFKPSKRKPMVALDPTCKRGTGEIVYFCEGGDAPFCNLRTNEPIPTDATIVGIVDHLDIKPETL